MALTKQQKITKAYHEELRKLDAEHRKKVDRAFVKCRDALTKLASDEAKRLAQTKAKVKPK